MLTDEQRKLVEENHSLIYWYLNRRGLDHSEYYDLLAIELCLTVANYNPDRGSLSNYFKLRADNALKKEFAKSSREIVGTHELNHDILLCGGTSVEDLVELEEIFDVPHGEILRMRADGHTQAEIAEVYGLTQSYISKIIEKCKREYYELD